MENDQLNYNEHPSWNTRKTPVKCIKVIQETPDVKTFQFQAFDPCLFHFKPGQFIGMQLEIKGEKHNRSYTISSSPSRPHILEITVKKEDGGAVSPWLHDNIKKGSKIELRGPAGRFNNLDISSDGVLLISAGSGITPMMSMARFWSDTDPNKDIKFLNWVRSTEDIIFRRELGLLEHKNDNFHLEVICTQPGLNENWLGRRGRINHTVLYDMVPDINNRIIFCCGPEGFMQQVKTCLQKLNFNMDNYHDESFDPGGKKKSQLANQARVGEKEADQKWADKPPVQRTFTPTYQVKLAKSNLTLDITPDDILLEALEAANVDISSACRGGNCGACIVQKLSGETSTKVEHGLSDEDRALGKILTCTTSVYSDLELDL